MNQFVHVRLLKIVRNLVKRERVHLLSIISPSTKSTRPTKSKTPLTHWNHRTKKIAKWQLTQSKRQHTPMQLRKIILLLLITPIHSKMKTPWIHRLQQRIQSEGRKTKNLQPMALLRHSQGVGRKFNHQYLRTKLADLWKIPDNFALIDQGMELYTVKFNCEEHQRRALQQGPVLLREPTYLSEVGSPLYPVIRRYKQYLFVIDYLICLSSMTTKYL